MEVLPPSVQKSGWFVGNDSQAIIFELLTALKQNKTKIRRKSQGYASCVLRDNHGVFYIYKDENQPDFFYTKVDDAWIISSLKYNQNSKRIPSNLIIKVLDNGTLTKVCKVIMPKVKPIEFDYEATSGMKSNLFDFYNGKYTLFPSSPKFVYADF